MNESSIDLRQPLWNRRPEFDLQSGKYLKIWQGPQHPGITGNMSLELTLEGDVVVDCKTHVGYLHRGFEKLMDGFHYDTFELEETIIRWRLRPEVIRETDNGKEVMLIGSNHTDRFRMHRLDIDLEFKTDSFKGFAIAIVVAGEGILAWDGGEMGIKQSGQIFVPAAVGDLLWRSTDNAGLKVVLCFPPAS